VSTGPDERAVAEALGELLPRRMLPDRVVLCPDLPTTAHGKVDRRRLAEQDHREHM
jgi:acyl-CoA synthetase (AMP-forming)/AMP-acid ligase II